MTHLEFLNKNLYRRYPFTKTSTDALNTGCFVALRVNQSYGLLVGFFFKTLSYVNGVFYGNLYGITATNEEIALGCFADKIVSSGQVLKLRQNGTVFASGVLVVGTIDAFSDNFYHELDWISGGVEPTCIGTFSRPGVERITVHPRYNGDNGDLIVKTAKSLVGDVTVTPAGITLSTTSPNVFVEVNNPEQIVGKGNKSLCAGNCDAPVIYTINTVTPDIAGNINIVGVSPVVVTTDLINGVIGITTPTIDRELLCQSSAPNQPPANTSNQYYTDLLTATKTEWQTWSQYND